MSLSIRRAGSADQDALWSLLEPVFRAGETYTVATDISREAALSFWSSPEKTVFLAEAENPLGTYYIKSNQGGGGAHVCNCGYITAAHAQGRGVAQAMLDHSLRQAEGMGFRAMQFNFVVASNTRAIAIWQRAGFEIVGRLPRAFEHPTLGLVDALVMWRDIP